MERSLPVELRRRVWVWERRRLVGLVEVVECCLSRRGGGGGGGGGGGRERRVGSEGFGENERGSVVGLQLPLLVVSGDS